MKKYIFFLVACTLCVATATFADFYTWQDEEGTTHITDYPPPQGKNTQNTKVYKKEADRTAETKDAAQAAPAKPPQIILFTKNECPECDKAREFLKSKNMVFTEYNMDNDKDAAAKRKEHDEGSDVPFAIINRSQVFGFSESAYNRALKASP